MVVNTNLEVCTVPWRRCKAKLPPKSLGAGSHYGRCDLKRGHEGDHWLERGMENIRFKIEVIFFDEGKDELRDGFKKLYGYPVEPNRP